MEKLGHVLAKSRHAIIKLSLLLHSVQSEGKWKSIFLCLPDAGVREIGCFSFQIRAAVCWCSAVRQRLNERMSHLIVSFVRQEYSDWMVQKSVQWSNDLVACSQLIKKASAARCYHIPQQSRRFSQVSLELFPNFDSPESSYIYRNVGYIIQ